MAPAACECSGSFFIGSQMKQIKLIAMRCVGVIGSRIKQMEQSYAGCRGISSSKIIKNDSKKLSVFKTKSAKSIIFVKKCRNIWSCQKKAVPLHLLFVGSSYTFSSLIKRTRYNRLPFGRNASEANATVHSYIGITPDFGSEKRGSTPRWTTKQVNPSLTLPPQGREFNEKGYV